MPELLNGKEYIRKLINIAYINIGVPLLFFTWVYLESSSEQLIPLVESKYKLQVFIPVIIVGFIMIFLGDRKFKSQLRLSSETDHLIGKLIIYQKGITIRFISYSFTAMLITIGFYFTDFQPFAALFGIMIVLFSIHNPTARKVARDLKLKNEDRLIILEGRDISKL